MIAPVRLAVPRFLAGSVAIVVAFSPLAPLSAQVAGSESLSQEANDPTASLMTLQFANWYTSDFHNLPDTDANAVVFRPVIPFKLAGVNNILRATVPFITDSPFLDDGLSDITVFDLMVFNASWGRWGFGPVALLPTGGDDRGADKWAAGPAVGFTARAGNLLWGVFNQNLVTFAGDKDRTDVNISVLQPIFNYKLGHGWTIGVSEMTFTYDWEADRWASLPLGVQLTKLVRFGQRPVQFSGQYEHDFADDEIADPKDTFRFAIKLLFPTG